MRAGQRLRHLLDRGPVRVHRGRLRAIQATVEGLLCGGRLTLTALGRSLAAAFGAIEKHAIKRVDRLLGNRFLWQERLGYFAAIAFSIVGNAHRIVILVDWTQVCGDLHALVASVPIAGRSVSVYFEVHPKSLVGNRHVQFQFLEQLAKVLPLGREVIIVADAGFQTHWFRKVQQMGWHYVGRLARFVSVRAPSRDWRRADSLWRLARRRKAIDLGWHDAVASRQMPMRLVLYKSTWKRRKGSRRKNRVGVHPSMQAYKKCQARSRQPWLLATSLEGDAADVVALYASRMQCEECFRDYKSHQFGFSLEDVRTDSLRRMTVVLLIATLAHLLALVAGMAAEHVRIAPTFQANTTRHHRVLSLVFLGRRIFADAETPRAVARRLIAYLIDPRGLGFLSEPSPLP